MSMELLELGGWNVALASEWTAGFNMDVYDAGALDFRGRLLNHIEAAGVVCLCVTGNSIGVAVKE